MNYIIHKRFKGKGIGGDFNLPYGTKCRMEGGLIYAPDGRCVCVATSENGWEHFHEDSVVGNERHRMLQWLYKYYADGEHGEDFAEDKWPGATNLYWKNLLRTMPTDKLTEYYNERRASCSITTSSYTRSYTTGGVIIKTGIDVSQWQGDIDWASAKGDIDFAIIRAGYGQNNIDPKWKRNADECTRLGIPFGVYWFSYAYTEAMARREAEHCLEVIKPYKLSYPVAFDYEYDSYDHGLENGVAPTKTLISAMARAFLNKIEEAGYYGMLYANPNYLAQYFDDDLPKRYDVWLAKWPYTIPGPDTPKPAQCGGIWQYTSSGSVAGINGRVDMNYAYYDYPALTGYKPEVSEPEDEPEVDKPMDYETEKKMARKFVMDMGISDGERGGDEITREEMWVMIYRMFAVVGG